MKIGANVLLAVSAPVVFLLLCEALLALSGVKPLYLTEDPFVGFSPSQPLFVEQKTGDGPDRMVTNPAKITHFNLQSFPKIKPEGTYRIFTLGGSTTYGHPWTDPVSFSGWLREYLPVADPGRVWEVINAGGISYASYREANLVEELSRYRPDLFVVYCGHNEFLEERTYRKAAQLPAFVREASALLDRTRTYTVMRLALRKIKSSPKPGSAGASQTRMAEEVDDVLAKTIGPTSYTRDDSLKRQVLDHYRVSLARMARIAKASGAKVLFLTTPANEKDCSPFKSEPRPGLTPEEQARINQLLQKGESLLAIRPEEAWRVFDSAMALDNRNADILYRAGKAALAAQKYPEAKSLFQKAVDEDICPLRALTPMRGIVRAVAEASGSPWIDFTGILEKKTESEHGHAILGEPDFVDHVHLTIEDYGFLARTIVDKMISMGAVHPAAAWGNGAEAAVRAKVMARGDTLQGLGLHNIAKVLNWAGKHEDAARIAKRALAKDSTNLEAIWSSMFVGSSAERQGQEAEAILHYRRAVRLDPANPMSRHYLADALLRTGSDSLAKSQFDSTLNLDPNDLQARESIARLLMRHGRAQEAVPHLRFLLQSQGGKAELQTLFGIALYQTGSMDEAAVHFNNALTLGSRDPWAYVGLGHVAEARGDVRAAVDHFSRALSINPQLDEARRGLSQNLAALPENRR